MVKQTISNLWAIATTIHIYFIQFSYIPHSQLKLVTNDVPNISQRMFRATNIKVSTKRNHCQEYFSIGRAVLLTVSHVMLLWVPESTLLPLGIRHGSNILNLMNWASRSNGCAVQEIIDSWEKIALNDGNWTYPLRVGPYRHLYDQGRTIYLVRCYEHLIYRIASFPIPF